MPDKKITLHPKNDEGQLIQDTNIYPKTTIDQVYSSDGTTPYSDSSFQKPMSAGDGIVIENNVISLASESVTFKNILLNTLYPVGSFYIANALGAGGKCPIELTLGGSWERVVGKFLYGAEDSGTYTNNSTGGNASISLSTDNLPPHSHGAGTLKTNAQTIGGGEHAHTMGFNKDNTPSGGSTDDAYVDYTPHTAYFTKDTNVVGHSHTIPSVGLSGSTANTGSGTEFSIMPPYLCVYIWKRTA